MHALRFLRRGLGRSLGHPFLILGCYAITLVPALLVVLGSAGIVKEALDRSLFADRVLAGHSMEVLNDLIASHLTLPESLIGGAATALILILPFQILLAAVIAHRLLSTADPAVAPTARMLGATWWRFVRMALWFGVILVCLIAVASVISSAFSSLATDHRDGRLELLGTALALAWLLLTVPLVDLANRLARLAAARHDHGSTCLGLLRALVLVLRSPRLLWPLAAASVLLPALLLALYVLIRSPWTVASMAGVLVLIVLQQAVMLSRAVTRVWLWAAATEAYDHLGQPALCHLRASRSPAQPAALEAPIVDPPQVVFQETETTDPESDEQDDLTKPEP